MTEQMESVPLRLLVHQSAQLVLGVKNGKSLAHAFDEVKQPERSAIQAITYHCLRHLGLASAVIKQMLHNKKVQDPLVEGMLQVAVCLLITKEKGVAYKPFVVVDETVAAIRKYIKKGSYQAGFVNAVLRNFIRNQQDICFLAQQESESAVLNYPDWWIAKVKAQYPDSYVSILEAGNQASPIFIRVNRRKVTSQQVQEMLASQSIPYEVVGEYSLAITTRLSIKEIPGFEEGWWSVQDLGVQRLMQAAPIQSGQKVLDACSAPGGKTAFLLEAADVELLALDSDSLRLERVQENLRRLGLLAESKVANCIQLDTWWDGSPFDWVLADVPCTASGIVSRHPEIKWLRREQDIAQSATIQHMILKSLWQVVRPGGMLMYVTCSIFEEENSLQVDRFLSETSDANLVGAPFQWLPTAAPSPIMERQNGFFYALFTKNAF